MTAELAVPAAASGMLMMTADEAKACVARIKTLAEEQAPLLLDLHDREGWRALGYKTWQECISHEFHMSRQHAHRLVNAAVVNRTIALMVAAGMSPTGDIPSLPERHAREVAPLVKTPERLIAVVSKVVEEKGQAATSEDFHDAVDDDLGRPAETATPVRRSISSKADAGDFADDYVEDVNQDVADDEPAADPYAESDPFDGLTPHPDGVSAPILADPAGSTDSQALVGDSALPATYQPAPCTSELRGRLGSKHSAPVKTFTARPLDAGDLMRALLDLPTAEVVEALTENATPAQKQALRDALSTGQPAPATAPGPRKPAEIDAEIEQLPIGLQRSLISSIRDRLTDPKDLRNFAASFEAQAKLVELRAERLAGKAG